MTPVLLKIWCEITEGGAKFKSDRGASLGLARDNVAFFETVGLWVCKEADALKADRDTEPPQAPAEAATP